MNIQELRGKSEAELQQLLGELRSKQIQLRFDMSAGKVKNIRQVRDTRKVIARIMTIHNFNIHAKKEA
jgi:ribosomal protein L29